MDSPKQKWKNLVGNKYVLHHKTLMKTYSGNLTTLMKDIISLKLVKA